MKRLSVFDVIGPIMIGPSSSHTAGAVRIGLTAYKLFASPIEKVRFVLYGSFARTYRGHGTDRALLGGIMGFGTEDERIRDSMKIAQERNIEFSFEEAQAKSYMHPNTAEIFLEGPQKKLHLVGESIGGGSIVIKQINHIEVEFTGEYTTIIIEQLDKPGIMAHITTAFMMSNINIATMKMFRDHRGQKAYTVLQLDTPAKPWLLDLIRQNANIIDAFQLTLQEA